VDVVPNFNWFGILYIIGLINIINLSLSGSFRSINKIKYPLKEEDVR
jgi:hypothetical protein